MEVSKFKNEVETLKKFFEIYCNNKHENRQIINKTLVFKEEKINLEYCLCKECEEKINYSLQRLLECPHDEKPSCRKCPNPCYRKKEWKEVAQVMRYSGMKLGLTSVKKKFKNLFN